MCITLRTFILEQAVYKRANLSEVVPFYIFYALVVVMVVLSAFSEKGTRIRWKEKYSNEIPIDVMNETLVKDKPRLKVLPDNYAPLLSRLSFWWLNDMIIKGFKKPLDRNDLWQVDEEESSRYLTQKLESQWSKETKAYFESDRQKREPTNQSKAERNW